MGPDRNDPRGRKNPWIHPVTYTWHWVYIDPTGCHRGWDGVDRLILKDGTVIPPFPEERK